MKKSIIKQIDRFHYCMPMEMVEWELYGQDKNSTSMATLFSDHLYFKKRCRAFLKKIKKRINEVVTNNESLKLILDSDIAALEKEIGKINKKTNNDIEIIAYFYMLIAHLLGWIHSDGEIYHTPIFHQTKSQQEKDLRKSSQRNSSSGLYEAYKKRQIILQLISEGNKHSTVALIMGMTETNVKHMEKAEHIDKFYNELIERRKSNNRLEWMLNLGTLFDFDCLFDLQIDLLALLHATGWASLTRALSVWLKMTYQPLDMFKKATSFLYREIGSLRYKRNHPEIFKRTRQYRQFFCEGRKRIALELYHKTKKENDPKIIGKEYAKVSGLTLEDIYKAFDEGDWKNSSGEYSFGGPKWASIAESTINLHNALIDHDMEAANTATEKLQHLEHNNGLLIDKFSQL